jgi:hypothetical protein
MALIDEWKAELKQSPTQYVNERKAQYQAKVRERLKIWQDDISNLAFTRSNSKFKSLTRSLEGKMQEVHDHLGKLEFAAVGAWEDLKTRIDKTSAYIGKHVEKLNSLADRRDPNS